MNDILVAALGSYTPLVLGLSLAAVVVKRRVIRRRHLVTLLVLTVVAFVAFFALLLASVAHYDGRQSLGPLHAALGALAAVAVGCGSAVGFSLILMHLGLAPLEDDDAPPRSD